MSEGLRFRRESAPFSLSVDQENAAKSSEDNKQVLTWKLQLPKDLSLEDFIGAIVTVNTNEDGTNMTTVQALGLVNCASSDDSLIKYVARGHVLDENGNSMTSTLIYEPNTGAATLKLTQVFSTEDGSASYNEETETLTFIF